MSPLNQETSALDFKKHLHTAWNLTLDRIVPLILITVVMAIVSFVTLGILAPVTMAGYIQALLQLLREGRQPRVGDLFSQMRLFLPLLVFGIVSFVLILLGFALFVLPGVVVAVAVPFFCLYMLPLMTDRRMGLFEAFRESCTMAIQGNVGEHIVVVVLFSAISALGGSVFVGFLFTQPLATLFLVSVYEDRISSVHKAERL